MCAEGVPSAADARASRDAAAAAWRAAVDPHAARATRGAPIDLRTTGPGSWPFRTRRRRELTSACPALTCAGPR
ncbi:MAG TPA: hypothetical protein VK790_00190 [Solirubrobacteraceae bacterium]|jgi:hypothetical protein|nr:hypothetical protein [Solirubrobacteraceae bacterium]